MSKSELQDISVTTFDAARERHCVASLPVDLKDSPAKLTHPLYAKLEESIKQAIEAGQFSTSTSVQERNVLRIVIHSLGSPLWGMDDDQLHSLAKFLFRLKGYLRSAYAVAMVTLPTHLIQDSAIVRRLEHLCDTVVALESFEGSDKMKNPLYKDYHGLFHICRLPRINSLMTHRLETLKWGFKLRRRKFCVDKLHLPPELPETTNRAQEDERLPCQGMKAVAQVKGKPLNALEF
jgi:elongator complex protein 4